MKPTEAQIDAGVDAAHALKESGSKGSFTANPHAYAEVMYEAMTAEGVMPAASILSTPRPRKVRAKTRKQA
jgi:hypothetical protein